MQDAGFKIIILTFMLALTQIIAEAQTEENKEKPQYLFPDESKEIKEFIKTNRIKIERQDNLIRLVKYTAGLMN